LKNEQARNLRKHYVFKVIMMLNPDGVSRGYYRLDSAACNLNRMYMNAKKLDHPTIWATHKAVVQQAVQYKCLKMFMDFHAHASKKGAFVFGNHITEQERQADNITFAKLIAMNCLNFDMNECNFSDRIMAVKDKNGQSREGSSRVAIAKSTGLTYCYTLEFNYHSGKRINTLAPKYNKTLGIIEPETELTDPTSKIYVN
jgi:cytosolic carboxypeptidase protein 5